MPIVRRQSEEKRIRERLRTIAHDYDLIDDKQERRQDEQDSPRPRVGDIVDLHFDAKAFESNDREHRAQLLRARKDLNAARSALATFETAWKAAMKNSFLLNYMLDQGSIPDDMPVDQYVALLGERLQRMSNLDDVAPIRDVLNALAQRDDFRIRDRYFPSQTRGTHRKVAFARLIAGLLRIAKRVPGIDDTPAPRNDFVNAVLKALGTQQVPKTIKNRAAQASRKR